MSTRRLEVRGRQIDADDAAVRLHSLEEPLQGLPGAASCIQDARSRRKAQCVDELPQLGLSESVEMPEFGRVVTGGRIAEQSARRHTRRGPHGHGTLARAARSTCMVTGRIWREISQRAMRRL